MRCVVVLLADQHAGHKVGLCHPETELMDEHGDPYKVSLTKTQLYLDELYQLHIEKVKTLADGCPVLVFALGDLCHGNDYDTHLCATTQANQVRIAVNNLKRWYEADIDLALMRIVAGTEAHTFGSASSEVAIHDMLKVAYPNVNISISYHLYFQLKNQRIRAKGADVESHLVALPAYCGIDDYVRGATKAKPKIDLGLVALEFDDGLKDIHPFFKELDVRTREVWDG